MHKIELLITVHWKLFVLTTHKVFPLSEICHYLLFEENSILFLLNPSLGQGPTVGRHQHSQSHSMGPI